MLSDNQLELIKNQIGREPIGCQGVSYSQNGLPVVLQMRSMVEGQPFPTLYWLCSRDLHLAIARLETDGWVKTLEQMLEDDKDFRDQYQRCHERYVQRRWALMLPEDRQAIEERGFTELFNQYGIGGISRWDKVRCLHMHVADYLSTPEGEAKNVIGAYLDEKVNFSGLDLQF